MTDLVVPAEGVTLRGLRRREYEQLAELGVFGDERVELLGGEVIVMSPQNTPHSRAIMILNRLLAPLMLRGYDVRVQLPMAVDDVSLPEPDVAVLPQTDFDSGDHPHVALVVIEVADSSLTLDLVHKAPRYAAAGVALYVVADVQGQRFVVHTAPTAEGYEHVDDAREVDVLGETITAAQVLGTG